MPPKLDLGRIKEHFCKVQPGGEDNDERKWHKQETLLLSLKTVGNSWSSSLTSLSTNVKKDVIYGKLHAFLTPLGCCTVNYSK